jgi:stearoyl-CoA desaturase (delta-9 desaturase)
LFFAAGFGALALTGAPPADAVQFGLSPVVWGGAVRTVIVWHQTWFVNSGSHLWGYRNYQTRDASRNNVWGGLLCNGDGWHNNHHADPNSAQHGHRWWEIDLSWLTIRLLMTLGLAKGVVLPSPIIAARFAAGSPQLAPDAGEDDAISLAPEMGPPPSAPSVAAARK